MAGLRWRGGIRQTKDEILRRPGIQLKSFRNTGLIMLSARSSGKRVAMAEFRAFYSLLRLKLVSETWRRGRGAERYRFGGRPARRRDLKGSSRLDG